MSLTSRLNTLGGLRDGFLVLGAVVYALGYVVWSVIAWRHDLGALPVLEAQYFIAGIPPALLLCAVVGVIAGGRRLLLAWWPRYVESLRLRVLLLVTLAFAGIGVATFIVLLKSVPLSHRLGMPLGVFFGVGIPILLVSALAIPTDTLLRRLIAFAASKLPAEARRRVEDANKLAEVVPIGRWQQNLYVHLLPLVFGYLALVVYVENLYVKVPQALGGARPRCARIDIRTNDVAPATAHLLGVMASTQNAGAPSESVALQVYFESDKGVILGVDVSGRRQVLELPRDAIAAIKWCE